MWVGRLLVLTAGSWGGSFGLISVLHYYAPPLLQGLVGATLLFVLVIDSLGEWERQRKEKRVKQ